MRMSKRLRRGMLLVQETPQLSHPSDWPLTPPKGTRVGSSCDVPAPKETASVLFWLRGPLKSSGLPWLCLEESLVLDLQTSNTTACPVPIRIPRPLSLVHRAGRPIGLWLARVFETFFPQAQRLMPVILRLRQKEAVQYRTRHPRSFWLSQPTLSTLCSRHLQQN